MIGHLRGSLLRKSLPAVLIDAGGVGYEVRLSLATFESLPAEGQPVQLEILTMFRNEALELYGFGTPVEKQLFNILMSVSGVGPKIALSLLSALPVGELVGAVRADRAASLERVPGIGRKTAQRLVLELKDKLKDIDATLPTGAARPSADTLQDDAVTALENLGYRRAEAEKAVTAALREGAATNLAALLRGALRQLGEAR